jgi:hypothetical protein
MKTCEHCGANLDAGEHCDCIGQQIADGRVIAGVDVAEGGGDYTVTNNPDTGEREVIKNERISS